MQGRRLKIDLAARTILILNEIVVAGPFMTRRFLAYFDGFNLDDHPLTQPSTSDFKTPPACTNFESTNLLDDSSV